MNTRIKRRYMSPAEFKASLNRLFPGPRSVTMAADFLHCDVRTLRRWKNNPDRWPIPAEVALLFRVMVNRHITPEKVAEMEKLPLKE